MIGRYGILLALMLFAAPAWAETPPVCLVARDQLEHNFELPNVARAVAARKLDILVIGTASSTLPGPRGSQKAYPARLQQALSEALPGVAVKVTAAVRIHSTAAGMVKSLKPVLARTKPALMIWQTGTVDAMQAIDPDAFSDTLEEGIDIARAVGADVILVNGQYSPRTESMIALGNYDEEMRWVALQHDVPLFNRFEIMRLWSDLGTFDFTGASDKLAMADQVHDCIGRLLAEVVTEAVTPGGPHNRDDR